MKRSAKVLIMRSQRNAATLFRYKRSIYMRDMLATTGLLLIPCGDTKSQDFYIASAEGAGRLNPRAERQTCGTANRSPTKRALGITFT